VPTLIRYDRSNHDVTEQAPRHQVALVDVLDRVLAGGVVIVGDVTLSIAEVDLVRVSLRALIASLGPEMRAARGR
jgi:hypothetical protein